MVTSKKSIPEKFIKDIRHKTRCMFTSEQKILIIMERPRAEAYVVELYPKRHRSISSSFTSGTRSSKLTHIIAMYMHKKPYL